MNLLWNFFKLHLVLLQSVEFSQTIGTEVKQLFSPKENLQVIMGNCCPKKPKKG
jgi:hypothetical protein